MLKTIREHKFVLYVSEDVPHDRQRPLVTENHMPENGHFSRDPTKMTICLTIDLTIPSLNFECVAQK
jgi:hypothetical protein